MTFVFGEQAVESKPQHQHDCSSCKFLGQLGAGDLYLCPGSGKYGTTYIVRYSSEGGDYYSNSDFMDEIKTKLREQISGGDDLYFARITLLRVCATGITNLMK